MGFSMRVKYGIGERRSFEKYCQMASRVLSVVGELTRQDISQAMIHDVFNFQELSDKRVSRKEERIIWSFHTSVIPSVCMKNQTGPRNIFTLE